MKAWYVHGCVDCPFFWPPHCNLLRLRGEIGVPNPSRVMDDVKRSPTPQAPPAQCPLREDTIAVSLSVADVAAFASEPRSCR